MKEKINNLIIIIIAIAIVTLEAVLIFNHVKENFAYKDTLEARTYLPSSVRILSEVKRGPELWQPTIEPIYNSLGVRVQAYCIGPGMPLGATGITKETIFENSGRVAYAPHGCASLWTSVPIGSCSDSYFVSDGEVYLTQDDCYTGSVYYSPLHPNLYDVGFIASYTEYSELYYSPLQWSASVQHAVWRSGVCRRTMSWSKSKGYESYYGINLSNESKWYQTFYEKIVARSSQSDPKMNPKDETNQKEVVVTTNTDNKTQRIGPFKVNYVNQTNDNKMVKFGGISNMYLVDDAGNKIEIKKILTQNLHYYYAETQDANAADYKAYVDCKWNYINGGYGDPLDPNHITFEQYARDNGLTKKWKNYSTPSYCSVGPAGAEAIDNNFEDYWDFVRFYPDSDENFYVEYDYSQEVVGSLHLHIDFTWVKCSASFVLRNSEKYQLNMNESHATHWHCNKYGCWPCYSCFKQTYYSTISTQPGVLFLDAKRTVVGESLDILCPNKDATMILGGTVFEDNPTTKETVANGILGDEDTKLKNMQVTLYEQNTDGTYKEAKCITLLSTKFTIPGLSAEQQEMYKHDTNKAIEIAQNYANSLSDQQLKNLIYSTIEESKKTEDYLRRTNPTLTDDQGYYEFRGVDTQKKYVVRFTYNGQEYLPTDYLNYNANSASSIKYNSVQEMIQAGNYSGHNKNSDENQENTIWKLTSKGTEYAGTRKNYDEKFAKIGSSPHNYVSSNSLGYLSDSFNETYTDLQLMGYTLSSDGKYNQTGTQLIDGYLRNENGDIAINRGEKIYSEGIITKKIKEFINTNKKYPDDIQLKAIYTNITNGDKSLQRKIQFIEDCKIYSWTKNQTTQETLDLYPVYNQFTTNRYNVNMTEVTSAGVNRYYSGATIAIDDKQNVTSSNANNVTYKAIYKGQMEINQGLWRRQEADAALRKDVYKAAVKINGKTEVYNYNKRDEANKDYWDINVRMQDYDAYYGTGYTRELYKSDYNGVTNADISNKLDLYVTYKITVKNQSQSILMQIPEIVDYFDNDYIYRDDLSWVTYLDKANNKDNSVTDEEYYAMMNDISDLKGNTNSNSAISKIKNYQTTESALKTSIYGKETQQDIENNNGYDSVYIQGLKNKKLSSGESEYIYLTFEVKSDKNGKYVRDDEGNDAKKNIAEINGYNTYYKDGTKLPNNVNKNSSDVAGILDRDSNPGNLTMKDISDNDRYEKNFEDDTDRAKNLKVTITDDIRKLNGTAWEDTRNKISGSAEIGDGYGKDEKNKIAGITVALYEVTDNSEGKKTAKENPTLIYKDNNSWERAITTTDQNGKYEFTGYIPGNYIVRFIYGDTTDTLLTNAKTKGNAGYDTNNTLNKFGKNTVSYNGQDYKSTTYQNGVDNGESSYSNVESCSYIYDIAKADIADKDNLVSDAKDIMSIRNAVENYSSTNITNHKAEVLASPYEVPEYNGHSYNADEMSSLISELISNTKMTAETGVIDAEPEYNRNVGTDGYNTSSNDNKKYLYGNDYNGKYVLNNVDLGLEERPKAQLKTTKQVVNVKITLANGNVLFDASQKATNVLWVGHKAHKEDTSNTYSISNNYKNQIFGLNQSNLMKEPSARSIASEKGKIQLTMDSELMHGSTMKVTYAIFVANIGEVDYKANNIETGPQKEYKFYYTGTVGEKDKVITTTPNELVDYVGYQVQSSNPKDYEATRNNLKFNAKDNADWEVIDKNNLLNDNLLNSSLETQASLYNTIIVTKGTAKISNKALVPIIIDEDKAKEVKKTLDDDPLNAVDTANNSSSVAATQLVLSQTLSSESKSDDLTYNNMVELVKTSNTVGRRMAASVVGNQNPTEEPKEVDADDAEEILILPPFGQRHYIYYILGIGIVIILGAGIIMIKKKVL